MSFHTQDLPWRFSGKLHTQGSQRGSSCVSSDSWLPLTALSYSSWNLSPPCPTVLRAGPVFIAQRSWVQLNGIELSAQVSARQEQGLGSHPWHSHSTRQLSQPARAWQPHLGSSKHLSHPLPFEHSPFQGSRSYLCFQDKTQNAGGGCGSHPTKQSHGCKDFLNLYPCKPTA